MSRASSCWFSLALLVLTACGDASPVSRSVSTPGATAVASAPPETAAPELLAYDELAKLSALGNGVTYQASYRSAPGPEGKVLLFTKYRKPPRDRQDVRVEGSGDVSTTFVLPEANYVCARASGAWRCKDAQSSLPSFSTDPGALGRLLREQLAGVATSERKIAGADTRCFSGKAKATPPPGTVSGEIEYETCFTADGIPLRLRTAQLALEATSFSRDVPDSVFELPAPVTT